METSYRTKESPKTPILFCPSPKIDKNWVYRVHSAIHHWLNRTSLPKTVHHLFWLMAQAEGVGDIEPTT
jgi:hypothetical protein